jgi:hypothetical protein
MQLQLYGKNIWVFRKSVDFRCSIDGLSALIATDIKHNPQVGIYLFFNRGKDRIKVLSWHRNGFVLIYKRLEHGKFSFAFKQEQGVIEIDINTLGWLLAGLDWQKMCNWRELSYDKFT